MGFVGGRKRVRVPSAAVVGRAVGDMMAAYPYIELGNARDCIIHAFHGA